MGKVAFSLLLLVVVIGSAFTFPSQNNKYENIPPCMQPAEAGLCLAYFPSWFYNPSSGKCESFIYGGCQGNANRFVTEEECMEQCGNTKLENKEFKLILENDEAKPEFEKMVDNDDQQVGNGGDSSVCALQSDTGPCRGMMKRFYSNGGKCEEFIFGGCQGNGNNFKTVEECKQKCESEVSDEDKSNSEEQKEDKVNEEVASTSEEQ